MSGPSNRSRNATELAREGEALASSSTTPSNAPVHETSGGLLSKEDKTNTSRESQHTSARSDQAELGEGDNSGKVETILGSTYAVFPSIEKSATNAPSSSIGKSSLQPRKSSTAPTKLPGGETRTVKKTSGTGIPQTSGAEE